MYCINCGKENIEGATFCCSCGTKIGEAAVEKKNTKENIKSFKEQLLEIRPKVDELENLYNGKKKKDTILRNAWGYINIFLFMSIIVVSCWIELEKDEAFLYWTLYGSFILEIIVNIEFALNVKKDNKIWKEVLDSISFDINDLNVIPDEYCNVECIDYMIKMIDQGRASSKKEIYKLVDTLIHRKEVTKQQNLQTKILRDNNRQLRRIKRNTSSIAFINSIFK